MKRTAHIRLLLAGTLACVPFAGCDYADSEPTVSTENTYTNNYYVQGHGYYHAPYRSWYPYPYNYYESGRGYYHGGIWTTTPESNRETASRPSYEAASHINSSRGFGSSGSSHSSSISRGGFGHSSSHGFS